MARMHSINVVVPIQMPAEMMKHLLEDTARNAEMIKAADIKLEWPTTSDSRRDRWGRGPVATRIRGSRRHLCDLPTDGCTGAGHGATRVGQRQRPKHGMRLRPMQRAFKVPPTTCFRGSVDGRAAGAADFSGLR